MDTHFPMIDVLQIFLSFIIKKGTERQKEPKEPKEPKKEET